MVRDDSSLLLDILDNPVILSQKSLLHPIKRTIIQGWNPKLLHKKKPFNALFERMFPLCLVKRQEKGARRSLSCVRDMGWKGKKENREACMAGAEERRTVSKCIKNRNYKQEKKMMNKQALRQKIEKQHYARERHEQDLRQQILKCWWELTSGVKFLAKYLKETTGATMSNKYIFSDIKWAITSSFKRKNLPLKRPQIKGFEISRTLLKTRMRMNSKSIMHF